MALTKKKGTKATPKLPDINALKQVNSNDAGAFYNNLFSAQHKVEYANKDIALSNIRTVIWTRKMISESCQKISSAMG